MKLNTKPYEKIIKRVHIDDREHNRIDYAKGVYAPFNPIVAHLNVGDYIFESNDGRVVAFEYKTGSDFLNSINSEDKHLHNQVYELMTNFDYRFVIIECEDLRKELNNLYFSSGVDMSLQQVNGAVAEFNRVCTVVNVQTKYQAFDYMMRQSGKLFFDKDYKWSYGKKSTNFALNTLSAMKGLDNRADDICRTLKLRTLNDVLNIRKEDLLKVKGIGDRKADMILKNIWGDSE